MELSAGTDPGTEIVPQLSVGKELIEWAEHYWQLDKVVNIQSPDKFAGETCDYKYMRKIFIQKIDSIIAKRMAG